MVQGIYDIVPPNVDTEKDVANKNDDGVVEENTEVRVDNGEKVENDYDIWSIC